MSRGWESKSVEEKQAEAARPKGDAKPHLTPDQATRKREKDSLLLSRNGVLQQIRSTRSSRHKQLLEAALSALDAKLSQI